MYKNIAKKEKLLLKELVAYQEGQVVSKTLVMPKDVPHAVYGQERFKMLLTVSF